MKIYPKNLLNQVFTTSTKIKAKYNGSLGELALQDESPEAKYGTEKTSRLIYPHVAQVDNNSPNVHRKFGYRRYIVWMLICTMLLLVCIPVGLWVQYRAVHVLSRNAMVRGNLAEIGTRLNGVLASVEVTEGEQVKAGQVLGRLEDRHIRSEEEETQAEIDGLQLKLSVERLAIANRQLLLENKLLEADANLIAAEAEVAAAQSRADNASESYKQRKQLIRSNVISREDLRVANTKRKTALAMLEVSKENHVAARLSKETVRLEIDGLDIFKQKIGILETDVLRAKARLEGAKADMESSLIRAPEDGAVVRWLVKLAGSVKVGKPVVSMRLGNDVWVEAWIDEDEISKVKTGSKALVTMQSYPDREFSGVVEKVGLTTDFEMPTFKDIPQPRFARMRGVPVVGILVRLHNPSEKLLPGLSAVVAIKSDNS